MSQSNYPSRGLCLNLGSGQRPFEKPWINIDTQEKWNPDIIADCSSLPMFEAGSADCICLHHVLEHFGCNEALPLLLECYRLLSPTGSLLVMVPEIPELIRAYQNGKLDTFGLMVNLYGAYMGDEADRHKWGYTFHSLRELLAGAGFRSKRFDFRSIPGANIASDWWVLGVEAFK